MKLEPEHKWVDIKCNSRGGRIAAESIKCQGGKNSVTVNKIRPADCLWAESKACTTVSSQIEFCTICTNCLHCGIFRCFCYIAPSCTALRDTVFVFVCLFVIEFVFLFVIVFVFLFVIVFVFVIWFIVVFATSWIVCRCTRDRQSRAITCSCTLHLAPSNS